MDPNTPFPIDHEEAAALLPWYVNGTLEPGERAKIQAHVKRCAVCCDEVAAQRALRERVAGAPTPERSPQRALARLRPRLEYPVAGAPERPLPKLQVVPANVPAPRKPRFHRRHLVPAALAAGFLLATLPPALQILEPADAPDFRTLSDRPVSAARMSGDLRLVFEQGMDSSRIDGLLEAVGGRRVETPDSGDVFTVRLTGPTAGKPDRAAAIAYLRRQEGVLFVEPIQPSDPP